MESNALASEMGLAVKNIVGAQRVARTVSEVVIVPRVNAGADSAPALQLGVNVTQMCVGTVGLVAGMELWVVHHKEEIIMNAEI